ncbi:MAG: YcnI family protein [Pseudolabrys sp.]|nr:YcnI family protein [Pseudolabrys sp.]
MTLSKLAAATTLAVALSAGGAVAHITLEQGTASPGSFYKAVLRVPHGCDKSATVKIRVTIPEGVISVKPMVKPGWTLEVKRGAYAKEYSFLHGAKFSEGPKEITWSGGNLPDAYYDEFAITTFIAGELAAGSTLYFPVVQECEKGVHNWVKVPVDGKPVSGDPAPGLKLLQKTKGHGE